MAPSTIRIAILEADVPIGTTRAKYGSYGGVFLSLLHKAADASHIPHERLDITAWDVINSEGAKEGELEYMGGEFNMQRRKGYPKLEDVDAVLITGSRMWAPRPCNDFETFKRYNAFDNDPWVVRLVDFVKEVLAQSQARVIGVCYGHQIVGRALGAKVARSEGGAWEVSVCQVNLTEKGKELFGGKDAISIHQMHKDIVYYYPEGVEELGSSGPCKVQGMYIPQKLITIQGHPEFTQEIVSDLLESRHKQNIFGKGIYEDGMARVGKPQDGTLVAQAFLKFLMEN